MTICNQCHEDSLHCRCQWGPVTVRTDEASKPDSVSSSDWMEELGAALATAKKARERYDYGTDPETNVSAENAVICLEEIIDSERRRSSIVGSERLPQ